MQRYRDRLSGPLLDRFDLLVDVARPGDALFTAAADRREESSAAIRERVIAARERQRLRQGTSNSTLGARELGRVAPLTPDDQALLVAATHKWGLSARAYHRVLRVARSIADLEDTQAIASAHVAEALAYRVREAAADNPGMNSPRTFSTR
ncbi:MAG: ATP-binding protein [Pseudomonadales bacterium]|nr:ATP-binding protein [Pseudomonadales bacterium]MBP7911671.1 ATP-binding protein [Pseudomonadales bacterium]